MGRVNPDDDFTKGERPIEPLPPPPGQEFLEIEDFIPVLPYAGTSGWSGSDTSRERAVREDEDGTTTSRQKMVLAFAAERGEEGITYPDLCERFEWHHGQASGALSVLHKESHLARLTETRDRCAVYVLPTMIADRPTAPHGRNARKVSTMDITARLITWARHYGRATPDEQREQVAHTIWCLAACLEESGVADADEFYEEAARGWAPPRKT